MKNYKKTFATIFIGQTMSLLTSAIVQYAIIWYITFKTGSAMDLAFATIAGILPQILLGPFAGVFVDRWNRKKVMIISDSLIAVSTLILGLVFMFGAPSLWGLYIVLAIRSLGSTFHSPSFQASIPLLAPEDKIVKIAGINQMINSLTLILAPIIAGALFGIIPIEYIIFLDIIGALFGVGSILMVSIPNPKKETEQSPNVLREMKEGFLEIGKSKYITTLVIFMIVVQLLVMPIGSMFPLMTSNYFKLQPIHVSLVEVLFAGGMLVGGILISIWGGFKRKHYTILWATIIMSITLIISGIVPINMFWLFLITCFFMGMMMPAISGIAIAILQIKIAPDKLGRVYSLVISLISFATPIGLLLVSPIAEKIGVEKIFTISGILVLIVSFITLSLKSIRTEK